jgi:hypothetical protein
LTHDSEKGTLSASIWTGDHQVHSWLDLEVHFFNEDITVW